MEQSGTLIAFSDFALNTSFVCGMKKFAVALPTERTEAILEGMVQAFEFFGCIPREVWWDNPKAESGKPKAESRNFPLLFADDETVGLPVE